MDRAKYSKVLSSCALLPDLEILQGGDMTEIGEKVNNNNMLMTNVAIVDARNSIIVSTWINQNNALCQKMICFHSLQTITFQWRAMFLDYVWNRWF